MTLLEEAKQRLYDEGCPPVNLPVCDHYAGSPKFAEKALAFQHHWGQRLDITLDLEDGAQVGKEAVQLEWVAEVIASEDNRFNRIGVRIHDLESSYWLNDIEALIPNVGDRLAYITVPKVRDAAQVSFFERTVQRIAQAAGLQRIIPLHVLIETHTALRDVWALAAQPAIECLSFGLMDFVSAHYGSIPSTAMRSPGQFQHPLVARAKLEIAAAAAAHGKIASHNVTTEVRDASVVRSDAMHAKESFGFSRMWSIHPIQIEPIIDVFSLSQEMLTEARTILEAARTKQWGPIRHGDTLHDRASYRYYAQVLERTSV
ncbi:MAG: aldolase/citrate lyase family protein [Pseudomonadota bacterium]